MTRATALLILATVLVSGCSRYHCAHVVWTDGTSIFRLPVGGLSVPTDDFVVDDIEVTQGIQRNGNDVPLAQGKTTYARVQGQILGGGIARPIPVLLWMAPPEVVR